MPAANAVKDAKARTAELLAGVVTEEQNKPCIVAAGE